MKVSSLTFLTVSVVFLSLFGVVITANAQKKEIGINTVVIDAGHGGRDAGAVGRIYKEKISIWTLRSVWEKMIGQKYPDVKVVYTRKTDVLIPLNERGNIANKAGADLFISIHINSNKSSAPSGTSTYVMGVDKAGKNLDVAMKENDVISYEDDYSTKYQGYVPGSPESFIIFSLIQSAYLSQSLHVRGYGAETVCQSDQNAEPRRAPGRFLVLWSAAMPSILAEFGFISNPAEEKFVGSDKGRETYARCLFNAFSEYKVRSEGRGTRIVLSDDDGDDSQPRNDSAADFARDEPETAATESAADDSGGEIVYRVQVASAPQKLPKNSSRFGPYRGEVQEIVIGGTYKYFVGGTSSYHEALSLQTQVRKSIRDAFLVAFDGDKTIPVGEARLQAAVIERTIVNNGQIKF